MKSNTCHRLLALSLVHRTGRVTDSSLTSVTHYQIQVQPWLCTCDEIIWVWHSSPSRSASSTLFTWSRCGTHGMYLPTRYVLFVVISFCPGTQSAASQFIPSISDTPPAADWGWGVLQARTWFRQMHRLGSSAVIILLSIWRAWITRSALSALHELMVDDSHWQTHCAAAAAALLWRRRAVVRLQRVCDIEPAMHSVCIAAPHC